MQDRATDLLSSTAAGDDAADGAYEHVRARVQALIGAARDLSDTCADLADALRPLPGHEDAHDFGRLRAERTAALLDEAASAARGTLGLLHSAYSALERQIGRPPVGGPATPPAGTRTWPDAFVAAPSRMSTVEDEAGTVPAARHAEPDALPVVGSAGAVDGGQSADGEHAYHRDPDHSYGADQPAGGPGGDRESGPGSAGGKPEDGGEDRTVVARNGAVAADVGWRGANGADHPDRRDRDAVTTAALAGWVALDPDDEEAGGRPILGAREDRPWLPDSDRSAGPDVPPSVPDDAPPDVGHDTRSTRPDGDRLTGPDDNHLAVPGGGRSPQGTEGNLPWRPHDRDRPTGPDGDWLTGRQDHILDPAGGPPAPSTEGDRLVGPDDDRSAVPAGGQLAPEGDLRWRPDDGPTVRDEDRPTLRDDHGQPIGPGSDRPTGGLLRPDGDRLTGREDERLAGPGDDRPARGAEGDLPWRPDDDRPTWPDHDQPAVGVRDRLTGPHDDHLAGPDDGRPVTGGESDFPRRPDDDRPTLRDDHLPTRPDGDRLTGWEDERLAGSGDHRPITAGEGGLPWRPDDDRPTLRDGDEPDGSTWADRDQPGVPVGHGPTGPGDGLPVRGGESDLPWRPDDDRPGEQDSDRRGGGDDEVAEDDRPTRAVPVQQAPAPMLTLPVDPQSGDGPGWHGDTVSPEPRSLSLVRPVPEPDPDPDLGDIPHLPEPTPYRPEPTPYRDEASDAMPAPEPNSWTAEPRSTWRPVPGLTSRPVWATEVVPGASAAGDGLPVYPLDTTDVPAAPAPPLGQAASPVPSHPLDDPGAAVIARQVEAARRHLQAALLVANQPAEAPRLGALLTAVERVLTAVTDLARETRGVLESGLTDRAFPGEARFLCSQPWERTELVGRDAYGEDAATPSGLAKLLRALGYEATSVTSAGGVAGVQVRSDRYAAHIALVEPAGGGRQRWSGALEWRDAAGASRTWAETLGPVDLEDEELARRVDELLRRCVGPAR